MLNMSKILVTDGVDFKGLCVYIKLLTAVWIWRVVKEIK